MLLLAFCALAHGQERPREPGIDVVKMAREFAEARDRARQDRDSPLLRVLVSFSMPPETLERLVNDAAIAELPLVLRGLVDGSMRLTAARIRSIDPEAKASWLIDPRPFRALDAKAVPVFLVSAGQQLETIRGDVSIEYAMRRFVDKGGAMGKAAALALQRLENDR